MRRRELIVLLSGVVAWPLAAHAQQAERVRHIGVLMNTAAENPEAQSGIEAFQQVLQQSGWMDGQNIHIDVRWGENDVGRDRRYAAELVALEYQSFLCRCLIRWALEWLILWLGREATPLAL